MFSDLKTAPKAFALAVVIGLAPLPVQAAQKIWDDELRRYITEEEIAKWGEEFMTEEEALKLMLPKSERIKKETIRLTPEKKQVVESRIGWKFPEEEFEIYIGETGARVDGYAMVSNTIGKYKHMTYMVGTDNTGEVTNVELMVFRDARGSEVGRKRFNYQYEGKTVLDPLRLNKDIINISGATMSVRSMSAGVKRVLVLIDEMYLKPIGKGSDQVVARRQEKGFLDLIFGR
ncbi:MAG: FMN-binding protein [Nitrospirota bacterium]